MSGPPAGQPTCTAHSNFVSGSGPRRLMSAGQQQNLRKRSWGALFLWQTILPSRPAPARPPPLAPPRDVPAAAAPPPRPKCTGEQRHGAPLSGSSFGPWSVSRAARSCSQRAAGCHDCRGTLWPCMWAAGERQRERGRGRERGAHQRTASVAVHLGGKLDKVALVPLEHRCHRAAAPHPLPGRAGFGVRSPRRDRKG